MYNMTFINFRLGMTRVINLRTCIMVTAKHLTALIYDDR